MGKAPQTLNRRLMKEAAPLIKLYKKRVDEKYYARVRDCFAPLTAAAQWADAAAYALSQCVLDKEHTSQIDAICGSTTELFDNLAEFREKLPAFGRSLQDMAATISFCTAVPLKTKKGRKPLKYLSETKDLMEIYERVMRKQIPFPKGTNQGAAIQPSVHFIATCLKTIDPKVSVSNTITNIRRVLEERNSTNVDKIMAKHSPELSKRDH
jgi:hypothetical protein